MQRSLLFVWVSVVTDRIKYIDSWLIFAHDSDSICVTFYRRGKNHRRYNITSFTEWHMNNSGHFRNFGWTKEKIIENRNILFLVGGGTSKAKQYFNLPIGSECVSACISMPINLLCKPSDLWTQILGVILTLWIWPYMKHCVLHLRTHIFITFTWDAKYQ